MKLNKRYQAKGTRKFIQFLLFYLFLASVLWSFSTFAKYITTTENDSMAEIANWQIKVNNQSLESQEELTNVITLEADKEDTKTTDRKLAPGQTGHFDIVINPEGTDVAVQYAVSFATENLPQGLKLENYQILEDNIQEYLVDNSITGEINLTQNLSRLSENDKKTIRVNWEWEENSTEIPSKEESYAISATIVFKQKLDQI